MHKTSAYNNVDELPDLNQKLSQQKSSYSSVDELPDLKKKVASDNGLKEPSGGGVSGTTSTTDNNTQQGNPFAIGGQYNKPQALAADKLDLSNTRQNADIAEQVKAPLKRIPITPILDNTNIQKPVSEIDANAALERQKQHKIDMQTAIDNTTEKVLKNKGISATKGSPLYEAERKKIEDKTKPTMIGGIVVNGAEATYHKDKNGNIGLDRNLGFLEGIRNGYNEAVNGEDEANAFSAMDTNQKVEYANKKMQENPNPEYMSERSGVGGLIGGSVPYVTKAALAGTLAAAATIAAPETAGASLEGLAPVLTVLLTAPDMIKQGAKDEIMARYQQLKQERPEMSDTDLMKIAEQGQLSGQLLGAANALAYTTSLKLPIADESKSVLKSYLNGVASSAVHLGGITAAGKATQLAERKLEGYNVDTDKAINEVTSTFTDNATAGAILNGLISGAHILPNVVKSAFKYSLKDTPTSEIQTALQANVDAGRIPPEVADKTLSDINGYKAALAKTADGLTPETQASVAGLIQARDNVAAEMATKDPTQHAPYEQKIEAYNKQIEKITKSNDPFKHEVDEVTGNKITPPSELPDLTQPIEGTDKKGVPVGEDVPPEVKTFENKVREEYPTVKDATDKEVVDFAKENAADDPTQFIKKFGQDKFDEIVKDIPTKDLQDKLDMVIKGNSDSPNVDILDKIISERDNQQASNTSNEGGGVVDEGVVDNNIVNNKINKNEKESNTEGQNQSSGDSTPKFGEKSSKEKQLTIAEKAKQVEDVTDPYDRVLQHFATDGKIHGSAIEELFGGKDKRIRQKSSTENERRARISLIGKDAPTIDGLAHDLWESDKTGKHTTEDYKDAIERVLSDFNSKSAMQKDLVERYDLDAAYQKYLEQAHGNEAMDIVNRMSDEEINHLLELDAQKASEEEIQNHIESLSTKPEIKNEEDQATKISDTTTEGSNTAPPNGKAIPEAETGEEGDKRGVAGIAAIVRKERAAKLGTTAAEPGEGWSVEDAIKRGEELRKQGIDPNAVLDDFNKSNAVSGDMMAVVQNKAFELVQATEKAGDEYMNNPNDETRNAYAKAQDVENKWMQDIKPMQTEWQKLGAAQQGVINLDTNSYSSVKKEFSKVTEGEIPNKAQEAKIKELTETNKKLQQQSDDLEKKNIELTDKYFNGDKPTSDKNKFENKARKLAEKIMKSETPSWLKIDDPNIKKSGFGDKELKKLLADATINMGKLLDKGVEFSDAVKEAIKDLVDKLGEGKREEIEKGFTQHYNDLLGQTPEAKNIRRLEKELEDLQNGIAKQKSPKRDLSDREKKLQEQIKDEKEKLGLIPSKQEKPLTDAEKIEADNKELEALQKQFAGKKDNKFSFNEAKSLWNYAKKNYLDKGVKYRDMIKQVSQDTGLKWKQVSEGITSPKIKPITDSMWKKQGELSRAQNVTKIWIDQQSRSVYVRAFLKASAGIRGLQVFGHAGVFMGTHAGMTLAQPSTWDHTIPAFFRAYKFAYGNEAAYERSLQELRDRPLYLRFERLGLKNNPDQVNTEEFQKDQNVFTGTVKKIGLQGIKGFNALKVLRQDLAEHHYDKLTEAEKQDDAAVQQIVKLVNNATGATNLKMPEIVNEVTFAGGMEAARWGKLTRNPLRASAIAIKAIKAQIKGEKIPIQEKVFAKVWAYRVGEQLVTYGSLLAANAAIQSLISPSNPTNILNPNKKDWLRPKFGSVTIDPTSGMLSTIDFIKSTSKIPFENSKELHGDTKTQAIGKSLIGRVRGKLAPAYSTIWDLATQTDYNGNQLPLSNIKPDARHRNIGWLEWSAQRLPIPVAEGLHEMFQSAADNGTSPTKASNIFQALLLASISGSTGARASESNKDKPSPFTEEDNKKPAFKYFLDKGLELPNTALSSEEVTDEKNRTKKKVSDYPKDIQDKYTSTHKDYLEKELSSIKSKGFVYSKTYTTTSGEKKTVISINKSDRSKRVNLDDLDNESLAQVLRIAQSQATQKTKKKIFKQ